MALRLNHVVAEKTLNSARSFIPIVRSRRQSHQATVRDGTMNSQKLRELGLNHNFRKSMAPACVALVQYSANEISLRQMDDNHTRTHVTNG
jgi:hypothetical protein